MKTYRHWIQARRRITIGKETKEVPILAGSDVSKADAEKSADHLARIIQERIDHRRKPQDYEPVIKEWVEETLDEKNIVTVNRYGALVLNTMQYTILDLDDIPFEFMDLFGRTKGRDRKSLILERFKKRLAKQNPFGPDLRIYETTKGLRIIAKEYLTPRTKSFQKSMARFHVDSIYAWLCMKQDCYRARLTPKPYRIHQPAIRIRSPLDCETEAYRDWKKGYASKSKSFRVARLLESAGADFSSDPAIAFHDRICNCGSGLPLA
ncbi:MAG TPA: hypothetical protein PKO15_01350 [Fibrobacteria bacterium]|nr:hypothetical protein [Fibrobacteria bacterium]HOX50979.1 hypothetical protein [Fibrobacteria bacterium]